MVIATADRSSKSAALTINQYRCLHPSCIGMFNIVKTYPTEEKRTIFRRVVDVCEGAVVFVLGVDERAPPI
jgi:hypothetical protein